MLFAGVDRAEANGAVADCAGTGDAVEAPTDEAPWANATAPTAMVNEARMPVQRSAKLGEWRIRGTIDDFDEGWMSDTEG